MRKNGGRPHLLALVIPIALSAHKGTWKSKRAVAFVLIAYVGIIFRFFDYIFDSREFLSRLGPMAIATAMSITGLANGPRIAKELNLRHYRAVSLFAFVTIVVIVLDSLLFLASFSLHITSDL